MEKQNRPTEKMQIALRKFKIPEQEIQAMNFIQASNKLSELINNAKKQNPNYTNPTKQPAGMSGEPIKQERQSGTILIPSASQASPAFSKSDRVRARLKEAKKIVAEEIHISEEDINPDSMVLYETMRQLYGENWLEKV